MDSAQSAGAERAAGTGTGALGSRCGEVGEGGPAGAGASGGAEPEDSVAAAAAGGGAGGGAAGFGRWASGCSIPAALGWPPSSGAAPRAASCPLAVVRAAGELRWGAAGSQGEGAAAMLPS